MSIRFDRPLHRTLALVAALLLATLTVGACNTVKGIGEDVSAAGQSLADVAEDTAN